MSVTAIRAGLGACCAATGIARGFTEEPDSLQPPAYVVGNPTVTYSDDFDGDAVYTFPVLFVLSRGAGSSEAIRGIDPFIDPSATTSLWHTVQANSTLGGACSSAVVKMASQFNGGYTVGSDEFAGVAFEVEVLT